MRISKITALALLLSGFVLANAQTTSASYNLIAQPVPDRSVLFNVSDNGVSKPMTWGLDLAWLSEANVRRGIAFMGIDNVDLIRASFQPTLPLVNGDLQGSQITDLNTRLNIIALTGPNTKVVLNCDHPSVDASYIGNAANWAALIDATAKRVKARGRSVISVSPFNEPDFGWGQYSGSNGQSDFYNIAGELRKNPRFDTIRISGGNTLNCDQALPWYNYLKARINEGNTHQLAGSFDNFAAFYTAVKANGHVATGDELHNVMEPMVGVEYGMQNGIWWGTAELARGEFVKASDGVRLGYAEHRPNWTAASVYRNPAGKVQAFCGGSERQAVTTTFRYVSKDRDVYYDGYGPQREYTLVLPGGTGYQTGQTNAERVVNITWGDDIQPAINGNYVLVNRNSGKVIEVTGGSTAAGATIRQNSYAGATYQQWKVTPVDSRIGGDFSYFTFTALHSGKAIDLLNWSLDNAGSIIVYDDAKGANQQWYLDYSSDGWFYIRSRHSAKCIEVASGSSADGARIQQMDKNGGNNQQWRFIPVGAPVEFVKPVAPAGLSANASATSIRLAWTSNTESDLAGYNIYRAESASGAYSTIARGVKTTSFVDNTVLSGKQYFYAIKAVDNSLNRSAYSAQVSATASGNKDLVASYRFETNTLDSTANLNNAATYGTVSYADGKTGLKSIVLNGTNSFVQLPATVANSQEITIAAWVYPKGITAWQRIFDFGNDATQYMFLTARANTGQLRFAIKNGGTEQLLSASGLAYFTWTHVAVTLSATGTRLYVNGQQVAESAAITISPMDFKPVLNYIGRSQYSTDPLFNGNIDDFRVYNYALSATEIGQLAGIVSGVEDVKSDNQRLSVSPVPANNTIRVSYASANYNNLSRITIHDLNGRLVMNKEYTADMELNVSNLPSGMYMLKLANNQESLMQKLIIAH